MVTARLSLSWELEEIAYAITAARILCEATWHGQHGTDDDRRVAPRAAAAVLSLVAQRLDLLGRVIGKEVNAKLMLAHHNIVRTQSGDEDGPDIFLEVDGASDRRS